MGILRKIGLFLISTIMVTALSAAIVLFAAVKLLHPTVYIDALDNNEGYSYITTQMNASEVIANDEARMIVSAYVYGYLDYLRGDTVQPEIDYTKIRTALLSVAQRMPTCVFGDSSNKFCKPAGANNEMVADEALKQVKEKEPKPNAQMDQARGYIIQVQQIKFLLPIIALVCAGLIVFIAGLRAGLGAIGGTLITTGISTIIGAILPTLLIDGMLKEQPSTVVAIVKDIVWTVSKDLLTIGIVILIIGLLMVITLRLKRDTN
jgi:hypothetical protein